MNILPLAILLTLFPGSAAAEPSTYLQDACRARLPPASFTVQTEFPPEIPIDHSRSIMALTRLPLSHPASRKHFTLGVTQARIGAHYQATYKSLALPSGENCVSPQVTLTLKYAPISILLGRELARGSCEWNAVYAHELRHVAAYRQMLPLVAQRLQAWLDTQYRLPHYYAESRGQIDRRLQHALDTYWLPLAVEELKRVASLHAEIDTPEEYARNSTLCDGAIPGILSRLRGSAGQ